jgi:hypothetical protein
LKSLRTRDPARTETVVRQHAQAAMAAYQKHLLAHRNSRGRRKTEEKR